MPSFRSTASPGRDAITFGWQRPLRGRCLPGRPASLQNRLFAPGAGPSEEAPPPGSNDLPCRGQRPLAEAPASRWRGGPSARRATLLVKSLPPIPGRAGPTGACAAAGLSLPPESANPEGSSLAVQELLAPALSRTGNNACFISFKMQRQNEVIVQFSVYKYSNPHNLYTIYPHNYPQLRDWNSKTRSNLLIQGEL